MTHDNGTMSSRKKKSVRGGVDSGNSSPHMPHLPSLSGSESEIQPHFRHAVKSLSDSDDDSSKSQSDGDSGCPSTSSASLYKGSLYGSNSSIASDDPATAKLSRKRTLPPEGNDDESTSGKKRKLKNGETVKPIISSLAQKMMVNYRCSGYFLFPYKSRCHSLTTVYVMQKNMGYKEGAGLGKYEQGRTAPVEASKQKGRRGLGAVMAEVDRDLINYDPAKEVRNI